MPQTITHFSDAELERLDRASDIFVDIGQSIGILSSINWEPEVAEAFFAKGEKELPIPKYEEVETASVWTKIKQAESLIPDNLLATIKGCLPKSYFTAIFINVSDRGIYKPCKTHAIKWVSV